MKKNIFFISMLTILVAFISSSFKTKTHPFFSPVPPAGFTGAGGGSTCSVCHGGAGGGNITAPGLPITSFTAGGVYNFSLTINHSAADRLRWGFTMAARNANGDPVGAFSSTNSNAAPNVNNTNDFSHVNAPFTAAQASYTFGGLTWTAPATPGPNDGTVTFYFVGNAANGNGSTGGDFIYAGSTSVVLPVTLSNFDAAVVNKTSAKLNWQTESETNTDYFSIEKSDDAKNFTEIATIDAAGNSNNTITYSYDDKDRGNTHTKLYYRITTVDVDGKKSYSPIKFVLFKNKVLFIGNPFPSPVKNGNQTQFEIVSNIKQTVHLNIYNNQSKLLKTQLIPVNNGKNMFKLDVPSNWSNGLYIANFTMNDVVEKVTFMVVN